MEKRNLHLLNDTRLCDLQPSAGCKGDDLFEIFEYWELKYKHTSPCLMYSNLYNLGKIHGKREDRARRKAVANKVPARPKQQEDLSQSSHKQYIDSLLDQLSEKDLRTVQCFIKGMVGVAS